MAYAATAVPTSQITGELMLPVDMRMVEWDEDPSSAVEDGIHCIHWTLSSALYCALIDNVPSVRHATYASETKVWLSNTRLES